jgi:hypothetical protein
LGKLKEIFRRYVSQHLEQVIALINPILRGWVNYFAVGDSGRVLLVCQRLGREESAATPDASTEAQGIRMETVE